MLTVVEATNPVGATLRLPLTDFSAGYSIREIDGLDPVTASLTSTSMAQMDGAQAQGARTDVRSLTMKIGYEPDYVINQVTDLRQGLWDWFMPELYVDLAFYMDDVLTYLITGQVETFTDPIFTDDPGVTVSVLCYDPAFYGPNPIVRSASSSNDTNTISVSYKGTKETGVIFALSVNATCSDIQVYNTQPDGTLQKMEITGSFLSGDVVKISSVKGQKAITLTRAGVVTSLLSGFLFGGTWISLKKGNNAFRAFVNGLVVPYTLTYTEKFGAVG